MAAWGPRCTTRDPQPKVQSAAGLWIEVHQPRLPATTMALATVSYLHDRPGGVFGVAGLVCDVWDEVVVDCQLPAARLHTVGPPAAGGGVAGHVKGELSARRGVHVLVVPGRQGEVAGEEAERHIEQHTGQGVVDTYS